MRRSIVLVLGLIIPALSALAAENPPTRDDPETHFELKVRPVLAGTCLKCHNEKKASGGLRLDAREFLVEGGDNGPAMLPGDPENSLIVQAIRYNHETLRMPPNKQLPKEVAADFATWIAAGAVWPESKPAIATSEAKGHWAFEPIRALDPPADPTGWAESPIDRFIAQGHRKSGLHPVAPADKRALIRRASFDLTGLPPTPEQVEAFVSDDRPDAFAQVVDRLLASPQYGERWGRYWLDLARYADTAGDNSDYPIPEAYLYRDYVIDAFNADKPYDQFLIEQIAGDLLAESGPPETYAERVIATGFLAQAKRFGTHKLEDMHLIIEDTLNTTGQVVLGLTLRCARCHDHKYDPITSKDYYGLYGFFASTQYPFAGSEEERHASEFAAIIPPDERKAREARHAEAIAALKAEIQRRETESDLSRRIEELDRKIASNAQGAPADCEPTTAEERERKVAEWKAERDKTRKRLDTELAPLRKNLDRLEKEPPADIPLAYAVRDGKPTDAAIQRNGNPRERGDVVPRGVPSILAPASPLEIPQGSSGRLQLAQWLASPDNPLTARVMVNRIWQHHFGKPIVPTPSDFGFRGTPPTHPELLDWLARAFIDSGWSIKAMHRTIMLSKTYQLASAHDASNAEADAGNLLYWRFDRRRLDAEALRDTLLTLGGNLETGRPGPHPFPPPKRWTFTAHHQFKAVYPSNHRSVYLMVQRLHPHPYLALFNGPDTSMSTPVRDASTVPLQALYLLNSEFVHDQASRFARLLLDTSSDATSRIDLAYQKTFARPASEAERTRALAFVEQYQSALEQEGSPADRRELDSWTSFVRLLLASNEFYFID